MSCCCSGCCEELLDGIRKEQEEEEGRRKMDVSLLREEYRSSRERRRRRTQVLLFRTVSEELSEAVSIVPVAQGLTSPWEPNGRSPSAVTFNPEWMICDPWHIHLDLHRRSCPRNTAQLPVSYSETSSRHSCLSSTEAGGFQHESRKLSGSLSSFTETSPCCTFSTTQEEEDPDPRSFRGSEVDQALLSPDSLLCTVSERSSTPIIASMVSSPSTSTINLHQDQEEDQSAENNTSNSVLEERSSRKFSAPALRFTRQLSVRGAASSSQIYYPFPSRKTQKISEAARRLGMYSSF